MKPIFSTLTLFMGLFLLLCSCQNDTEETFEAPLTDDVALTFHVSPYQQVPFDNAVGTKSADISSSYQSLLLAVYKGDKLDTLLSQQRGDNGFGSMPVKLKRGAYRIVILAHSSVNQPKMTNPRKIDFGENNLSDVLFWSDEIKVGGDSTVNVTLRRVVAKVEISSKDNLPSDAIHIYIRYEGGSCVFDAIKGKAAIARDDYRKIDFSKEERGKPLSVAFYTFPTDSKKLTELRFQISNGDIIESKTLNDVPIETNSITHLTGMLAGAGLVPAHKKCPNIFFK